MFVNVPLCGLCVSYADAISSYDPALIPMYALITSIAVATGIVGKNVIGAADQLISNAINEIKYNEVLKATSDNTYNSPYRVINSNGEPEKPNNNNKNGKWFALGAASSLGAAVAFEKGAVEDVVNTFNNIGAYKPMQGSAGIFDATAFKNQSTNSAIALQCANISQALVRQFDDFLHSDFWSDKDFTPNDCWFNAVYNSYDLWTNASRYPTMRIKFIVKNDDLKYIDAPAALSSYTANWGGKQRDFIYVSMRNAHLQLINDAERQMTVKVYNVALNSRRTDEAFTYSFQSAESVNRTGFPLNANWIDSTADPYYTAYIGYKWMNQTPWSFTQNVYNSNDTIINQYPNWDESSINLLGEQIDALRIGIQNLNNPWNATQDQIQQGLSPEEVISQILNNYLNPENAPDPDPNPDPEPYAPEVFLPFSETALEDGVRQLWEWTLGKITLPDGFWDKIPFSIPYDIYLLTSSMFPVSGGGNRRMLRAVVNSPTDPNGITISSNFDAAGINTRVYNMGTNKWVETAPVINLDLHFKYHDVSGNERTLDYVKTVDLAPYAYFAMIIYIAIYISWFGVILGFIVNMFK